ncbi:hypothetical protein [Shimia sp.]|uniref:hypothetical protein n=1 Tax=Shimia sp. TaxID=1954381 RepID=UPI00329A5CA2
MLNVSKLSANRLDIELSGALDADAMRSALDNLVEKSEGVTDGVGRQGFWNQWLHKLRERLAHLVGLIMRLAGVDASVALLGSGLITKTTPLPRGRWQTGRL